jgi:hypothetical protein
VILLFTFDYNMLVFVRKGAFCTAFEYVPS